MKEKDIDFPRKSRQPEKGRKEQKVRNILKNVSTIEDESEYDEIHYFSKIVNTRK